MIMDIMSFVAAPLPSTDGVSRTLLTVRRLKPWSPSALMEASEPVASNRWRKRTLAHSHNFGDITPGVDGTPIA
jgi:hypothetical protein